MSLHIILHSSDRYLKALGTLPCVDFSYIILKRMDLYRNTADMHLITVLLLKGRLFKIDTVDR